MRDESDDEVNGLEEDFDMLSEESEELFTLQELSEHAVRLSKSGTLNSQYAFFVFIATSLNVKLKAFVLG